MPRRSLAGGGPLPGAVSRLRFAPFSNNLMVSSWDSGLRLYDVDASKLRLEAKSEVALLDCCFKDESVAFAGGSDGSVTRYDLHSGARDAIGMHEDVVTNIELSHITGQLITDSLDKKLFFWDTHTRNGSPTSSITLDSIVASLSVCGMYILAAVGRDVYWYDMRNLTGPAKAKDSPVEHHIRCLHASSDWNGYAAGSVDGAVALKYFDPKVDGDMGYVFRSCPKSRNGRSSLVPINSIAVHPWKRTFFTGDKEGYVIAWDGQSKKKLLQLPRYSGSVASMAYNHSGQLLAVASNYTHQEADKVLALGVRTSRMLVLEYERLSAEIVASQWVKVEGHQIFVETVRSRKTGKLFVD